MFLGPEVGTDPAWGGETERIDARAYRLHTHMY